MTLLWDSWGPSWWQIGACCEPWPQLVWWGTYPYWLCSLNSRCNPPSYIRQFSKWKMMKSHSIQTKIASCFVLWPAWFTIYLGLFVAFESIIIFNAVTGPKKYIWAVRPMYAQLYRQTNFACGDILLALLILCLSFYILILTFKTWELVCVRVFIKA